MFVNHVEPRIQSGIAETTLLEIVDADQTGRLVLIHNTDPNNTLQYKWQYSSDKSIWNDIGVYATLAPNAAQSFLITRPENFIRLRGSGLLVLAAGILRFKSFNGILPLVTL